MLLQLSKTVKQSPKSPQIFENNGTFCADRPFSKNRSETNCQKSFVFNQLVSELQSYILSTTTETLATFTELDPLTHASIVHPFNNNWNKKKGAKWETFRLSFNRTSFQQQLKRQYFSSSVSGFLASIVHPFNNNWNPCCFNQPAATPSLQSYILSTTTETVTFPWVQAARIRASIVHPFNNNWNSRWWKH